MIDAQTGTVLFDDAGTTPAAPASTGKLLTAAAILAVHKPSDRFTTTVDDAGNGTIVLVGGGDPTLSRPRTGQADRPIPAPRGSATLGRAAAAPSTSPSASIIVDGSLFSRPVRLAALGRVRHRHRLRARRSPR